MAIFSYFCFFLAENDNIQARPPVAGADHDVTQLSVALDARHSNTASGHNIMNTVSVESAAVNGSHVMSTAGQSLSDASDIFRSPSCVIQSVYSLPIQQSIKCDGWENCSVTLSL